MEVRSMDVKLHFREINPNGGASEGIAIYEMVGDSNSAFIPLKGEKIIIEGRHFMIEERIFTYDKMGRELEILFRCKEVY